MTNSEYEEEASKWHHRGDASPFLPIQLQLFSTKQMMIEELDNWWFRNDPAIRLGDI